MNAIFLQLFTLFTPFVQAAITKWKASHTGEPTYEDIVVTFKANTDAILAEGAAWKAAHPEA